MKIFSAVIITLIILDILYYRFTTITFENYRGKINSLYCKLTAPKGLPAGPIIFVPGIKGSTLKKNDKTLWLDQRFVCCDGLSPSKNKNSA